MKNVSFVWSQLTMKYNLIGKLKAHLDFTGLRGKVAAILVPVIRTKKIIMFTLFKINVNAFFLAAFQGNHCTQ